MPLDHQSPRVVARKRKKKVKCCTSGNKSQITIVGYINAISQAMPPFIIFDTKNLNMDRTEKEVPGTTYGLSENGWIDMELFNCGFSITSYVMLEQVDPYCFCLMAIVPTTI